MSIHLLCDEDEVAEFCLFPLHPGPCRRSRRGQQQSAPPATQVSRSVPLRRTVLMSGGPDRPAPAKKAQGTVYGTPRKAAPAKAAPRSRGAAADAGNAAQMLLSGNTSVDSRRYVETLMRRVTAARQGGRGPQAYNRVITEAALEIGRVLANQAGGSPQERRRLMGEIANVASDAMRTGDTRPIAALHRRLRGARTASAAPREDRALALFGLQRVDLSTYGLAALPLPDMSLAHLECNLSVFCRNPLHPGPCKGWKGTLAKVAPGALAVIEAERKKKLAEKQKKIAAAKAAASKIVDKAKRGEEVDEHPNAKKKLAKKATAQILGEAEEKVAKIEGATKLSQKEMAWHANKRAAALLAANVAAGNLGSKAAQQKYRQYARAQILAALAADNESGKTGPDSEYAKTVAKLSQAIALGHADKHVKAEDDDSQALHSAVADAFDAAIQADVKNVIAGKPSINMKKLDKALAAIPGEPGDPDHDVAVGEAVGHTYTPAAPALPSGALSDEDADKLATGAEGILKLTTNDPDVVANSKAAAKKKAQEEGFADKQDTVIAKTAANVTYTAALQNADALDGFSPQGKKKFEKLLAAELEAMLQNGDAEPPAGSLAELVAMRKAGTISADELHAQLQKKLKIKSKKLEAAKKAQTAPATNGPAPGPAGGGAGAGGQTKAQAAASVYGQLDEAIYGEPSSAAEVNSMEAAVKGAGTEAEQGEVINAYAQSKAQGLINELNKITSLSPEQEKTLRDLAADIFAVAMKDPTHAAGAKNLIKNLKGKSPAQIKDFADAMAPAKESSVNALAPDASSGGSSVNSISTPSGDTPPGKGPLAGKTTPEAKAAHIGTKIAEGYAKLTGQELSPDAYDKATASLAQLLKNGEDPDAKAAEAAKALAKAALAKKLGPLATSMPATHHESLVNAVAAEILQGIQTGEFPKKGYLDSVSNPKGGVTKLKIKAKQAYNNGDGAGFGSTGAPTPPATSTKNVDLEDAVADAPGPPAGGHAKVLNAKYAQQVPHKSNDTSAQIASAGTMVSLTQEYEKSLAVATTQEEIDQAIHKLAAGMAGLQAGNLLKATGVDLGSDLDVPTYAKLINKLHADWIAAIQADADAPGGAAGKINAIFNEVADDALMAQMTNNFAEDSPALKDYKAALLQGHIADLLNEDAPPAVSSGGGAGAGGTGTGVNPGAAATTPPATPKKKIDPLPPAGPAPDFTALKKTGSQKGSNPGGTYEDAEGKRYYVKQQKTEAHARNEALASALYRAAGVNVPPVHVGAGAPGLDGTQTASQIVDGATPLNSSNLGQHRAAIQAGFAIDAWLGNWDVAGATMDNIVIGADGQPHRIDVGGSLEYRAQGGPKGAKFGDTVPELDTLRDPSVNPQAAKIFGDMTNDQLIASLEQLEAVTPEQIADIVAAQGGGDALAKKLIARRADMMKRLAELREAKANGDNPMLSGQTPSQVKLGGTKKKQKIYKPQGGYPVSQVVLDGHDERVAEYNARVAASANGKDAAKVPNQMSKFAKGTDERSSLYAYTAGSGPINTHLRNGGKPAAKPKKGVTSSVSTSAAPDQIAHMDSAFAQSALPAPITTLRGIRGGPHVFGALWTTRRDQNWTGAEFEDRAYSSSSVNMSTARGFAGAPGPNAVVMRIHMPAGTRAINLGGSSAFSSEAEILLNRGARFRIVADNGYQNGARHLDVEVICDGDGCAGAG